jgi:hypothetical protein
MVAYVDKELVAFVFTSNPEVVEAAAEKICRRIFLKNMQSFEEGQ